MTDEELQLILLQEALKARGFYKGAIDGVWGNLSKGAFAEYKKSVNKVIIPTSSELKVVTPFDPLTEKHLRSMRPVAQDKFREVLGIVIPMMKEKYDVDVRLISGTRTYAEQDWLYEQGRTRSGSIITDARGGFSNHNFGVAGDLGLFKDNRYLDEEDERLSTSYYREIAIIAKRMGMTWGGDWRTFVDPPHFQYGNLSIADMRKRVEQGLEPV